MLLRTVRLFGLIAFAALHVAAIAAAVGMLVHRPWRAWFEQRCLGAATAGDLGYVRVVTCAVAALYVLSENITSYALLDPSWFRAPAIVDVVIDRERFAALVGSAGALRGLECGLLVALALAGAGVLTRITVPVATLLYCLFGAVLRSFGKYFHEGMLPLYVLIVLCLVAAGDGWSIDARWRRPPRDRGPNYHAWAVYACFAAIAVPYIQLGLTKLIYGGPYWFEGASMRNRMLVDNLNVGQWDIDLALRFHDAPTILFTFAALFGFLTELCYPLVLIAPRLRRILPACVILLHFGVWLGQDALFVDAILMPAIFFLPGQWRRGPPR